MKITFEGTEDEVMRLLAGIGGGRAEPQSVEWSRPFNAAETASYDPSGLNPYSEGLLRPEHDILQAPKMSGDWNKPSAADTPEPISPLKAGPLPSISDDLRVEAWRRFVKFCEVWLYGWEQPDVTQPDRMQAMAEIGSGRVAYPILVMAYESGSLQNMVARACSDLFAADVETKPNYAKLAEALPMGAAAWNDFIARVTGSMVAASHLAFPDLAGTYDYSTKWRTT